MRSHTPITQVLNRTVSQSYSPEVHHYLSIQSHARKERGEERREERENGGGVHRVSDDAMTSLLQRKVILSPNIFLPMIIRRCASTREILSQASQIETLYPNSSLLIHSESLIDIPERESTLLRIYRFLLGTDEERDGERERRVREIARSTANTQGRSRLPLDDRVLDVSSLLSKSLDMVRRRMAERNVTSPDDCLVVTEKEILKRMQEIRRKNVTMVYVPDYVRAPYEPKKEMRERVTRSRYRRDTAEKKKGSDLLGFFKHLFA